VQESSSAPPAAAAHAAPLTASCAQTSCEKAPGVDINAGDGTINPPAVGPPFKANSTHPYDVWCVTVTAAERKDGLELPAEFGPGCREIRYRGVYDKACAYPASGEAQVATEE
jgi:hypothetical protein